MDVAMEHGDYEHQVSSPLVGRCPDILCAWQLQRQERDMSNDDCLDFHPRY
jgi:hypothetical protein